MGSPDLSHYDLMGVERNATPVAIKSAYRKMCLSLHPDKNPYGVQLMKKINEVYAILSDETKRRSYDRDLRLGGTNNNGQYESDEYYEEQIEYYQQRLRTSEQKLRTSEQKLRNSQSKNQELRDQLSDINNALADVRASSKSLTKKLKQAESKHQQTEKQTKKFYQTENDNLQESLNKAQSENDDLLTHMNDLLDLHDEEKKNAIKAMYDEKQKAIERLEKVKKSMLARSICYTCDGEGGDDCTTCKGKGSVQGKFTKCHNCNGAGTFTSLQQEGKQVNCLACFSKGAKEGCVQIRCFKCKGDKDKKIDCNICHKGKIRGFSLKPCPFCVGDGCMNCVDKGYVKSQYSYGDVHNGHTAGKMFVSTVSSPSSLQMKLKEKRDNDDDWLGRFMESANTSYSYYMTEWDKCRPYATPLTDDDSNDAADDDVKPSSSVKTLAITTVDEDKSSFASFNIYSNGGGISNVGPSKLFNVGSSKGSTIGGNRKGKNKKKDEAAGPKELFLFGNATSVKSPNKVSTFVG